MKSVHFAVALVAAFGIAAFCPDVHARAEDQADDGSPSLSALYQAVVNTPPRSLGAPGEHQAFIDSLARFLRARAVAPAAIHPRFFIPALVKFARTGVELHKILKTLGDPDLAVSVEDFVAIVTSGKFTGQWGEPLRVSYAARLLVGHRVMPAGEVTAHQLKLMAGLSRYVVDYSDWVTLLQVPGREPFVRQVVSDEMLSPLLAKVAEWPISTLDWSLVFSFYEPSQSTDAECDLAIQRLQDPPAFRMAIETVRPEHARLCLQRAALRKFEPKTKDAVEFILTPLGRTRTKAYIDECKATAVAAVAALARIEACQAAIAPRVVQRHFKVIAGGLDER